MENENQENNTNLITNMNIDELNSKERKDSNNSADDNDDNNDNSNESNTKIVPFEIENIRKRSSGSNEKYENVDILEHNDKSLISIQQVIANPSLNPEKGERCAFLFFYKKIPLNLLKAITILIIFLYMITGIIGVIYFSKNREENPFLFCFNFFSREPKYDPQGKKSFPYQRIIFSSDLNSFCIIHVILLCLLINILYSIISNKDNNGKTLLKDFSIFFPLTLLFNIPVFVLGINSAVHNDKFWYSLINIFFTLLGALCTFKMYISTKKTKYKNLIRVVNQGFLSGLLFAFELYSFMYNICYLSTWGTEKNVVNLEIIPGVIYFIISFLTIVIYNEIFFSSTALIIQIGLLYIKKEGSLSVVIFNICAVFFSFISLILLILKRNKKVFNIFIEGESKNRKSTIENS